jgi:Tol biopolymer transport system component
MIVSRLTTSTAVCISAVCLGATAPALRTAAAFGPSGADAAPIAFASHRDGNWEIYVMDGDGESRRLTRRTEQDRFPIWSPDGAQIAFGSQVGEAWGWELWVMDSTGARQRRLYSKIVAKSARGWCRDNKRIAFAATAKDGNVDIYTVDVESAAVTRLSSASGEDRDPSWSPDCQQLTFSSMRDGNAEIYVMHADGRDARRLTNNAASDESPVWSPDGSAITFVSSRDRAKDLYVMRPDGQGLLRLTTGAGVTRDSPRWSPDGSRIAIQIARGKNYDIGVVRLPDRAHIDFARSDAYDGMYAWSPDGTSLVFVSGRGGYEGLYRADADGRNVQRLTDAPALNPSWAPPREIPKTP